MKNDFPVSCRLLRKLAFDTFLHHTGDFPDWLQEIMGDWYDDLKTSLC